MTSIAVKRPASEKLNRDDQKRKKGDAEKSLFSIVQSRIFYQQKAKEAASITEFLNL